MTAPIGIAVPDSATLLDVIENAERNGLVLITDGRELKYSPAGHIPPNHRRFKAVDKAVSTTDRTKGES